MIINGRVAASTTTFPFPLQAAGQKPRITSKAFQGALRDAWDEVQEDEDRLARFSHQAEMANLKMEEEVPAIADADPDALAVAPSGPSVPMDSVLGRTVLLAGPIVVAAGGKLQKTTVASAPMWPTSVSALRFFLEKPLVDGVHTGPTYSDHSDQFHRDHCSYTDAVPASRIMSPPQPRWLETPGGATRRRERVEGALRQFLTGACLPGKPRDVPKRHLLVRVTVSDAADEGQDCEGHKTNTIVF